jgi:hypothetical protein
MKMLMEFGCVFMILFGIVMYGEAEVYIVTVEGEPIISYTGGVEGFEATAVESDEKIDTTRYEFCKYSSQFLKLFDV